MQETRSFFASEQKIYDSFNKDPVTKYFLVVFAWFNGEHMTLADILRVAKYFSAS